MKVIDLLNKIANGEEVPNKIKYINLYWEYDNEVKDYINDDTDLIYKMNALALNANVEIIEEEKEIEKLKIEQDTPNSNYYIKNEYGTKCYLTKHSKMIAEKVNKLIDEVKKLKEE